MTTKHDVINTHKRYPQWTCREIAMQLNCVTEYVYATAKRNNLNIPKARRQKTAPELRSEAQKLLRKAERLIDQAKRLEAASIPMHGSVE